MRRLGRKDNLFICVGMTLEKATQYLKNQNIEIVDIIKVCSPRQKDIEYNSMWHVIAIDSIDKNSVNLLISKPLGT